MLHMHVIAAIDDALNAAVRAHGVYDAVETARMEKDPDLADEIREGRLAPLHPDVEAMTPLHHMRARTLPAHVFYTVVAYQKDGEGDDEGVVTAIIAPGGPGRDVTTMTREEIQDAAVQQLKPMLDAAS
jgi:hypothetical protein